MDKTTPGSGRPDKLIRLAAFIKENPSSQLMPPGRRATLELKIYITDLASLLLQSTQWATCKDFVSRSAMNEIF